MGNRIHCSRFALIIGVLFFLSINTFGQIYHYTRYKVENGFPQSNVDCIYQDNEGFMWFATQIGIVKFDGFKYEVINKENGLNHNIVHHITQDQTNAFWISTKGGLCRIKNGVYQNYTVSDGLLSDDVYSSYPIDSENIFVCTSSGINIIKKGKISSIDSSIIIFQFLHRMSGEMIAISRNGLYILKNNQLEPWGNSSTIKGTYHHIIEDKDSSIWLATSEGIYKIKGREIKTFTVRDGLIDNNINQLLIDFDNNLWYSSEQSGFGKLQKSEFLNFTVEKGMTNTAVLTLFEDNERNIWIGGRNGVIMINPKIPFVRFDQMSPFEEEIVMGMTRDKKGDFWFCTYGLGIFRYNGKEFINYNKKNGSLDNHFFDVEEDQHGNLWFASASNGIIKYNGKTFSRIEELDEIIQERRVLTIFKDSQHNLWFGTNGNGVIFYDSKKFTHFGKDLGVRISNVMSINEDNDHKIWIGTVGEGLFVYDGLTIKNIDKDEGIRSGMIRSIVNEKGTLWFGTANNGIFRLVKGRWKYRQYFIDKKNGLQSNNIYMMYADSKGYLWVGSEKGVDRIKLENHIPKEIVNYSKDEGFTGVETNLNASMEDDEGNMWFGTINGVLKYNARNDQKNMVENKIYITDITLFHETFDKSKYADSIDAKGMPIKLTLPYDKNHLTFHFIGLCYSNPGKVNYRYRLLGHNNEWSPAARDNKAVFSNIEPGKYEFQVISANNNGLWNSQPAVFKFEITAPFWQKLWFRTLIIFTLIIVVYLIVEIRNKSLKSAKINLEKKVNERTFQLNEQKNKVEASNKKIKEGINYARKIQTAMLPPEELFKLNFSDYFILYLPKDIVSGDFYWARDFSHETGDHVFIAVADCTGHGIPGALVSMLGMALLNEIIRKKEITKTSQVLEELRNEIKKALKQKGEIDDQTEGIDMAVCDINLSTGELQFAGANNPLYILRNSELIVLKPTINPVGIFIKELPFENQSIKLQKDDILIMFTDGLIDQFNVNGEKFKLKRFRDIILNNQGLNLTDRKRILEDTFQAWKENTSQIDDVLVIAIKIK